MLLGRVMLHGRPGTIGLAVMPSRRLLAFTRAAKGQTPIDKLKRAYSRTIHDLPVRSTTCFVTWPGTSLLPRHQYMSSCCA